MPKKSPDAPAEILSTARDQARNLKLGQKLSDEISRVHTSTGIDIKRIKELIARRMDTDYMDKVGDMVLEEMRASLEGAGATSAPKAAKTTETPVL